MRPHNELMETPERRARAKIDDQLVNAGRIVQDRDQMDRRAGLGVAVREYPLAAGPADDLLLVDGKACGGVEAKKEGFTSAHYFTRPRTRNGDGFAEVSKRARDAGARLD